MTDSTGLLDSRLDAAARSDDPVVLRNTVAALAALKGRRLGLLADLVKRLHRQILDGGGRSDEVYAILLEARDEVASFAPDEREQFLKAMVSDDRSDENVALAQFLDAAREGERPRSMERLLWPRPGVAALALAALGTGLLTAIAMWSGMLMLGAYRGVLSSEWGGKELLLLVLSVLLGCAAGTVAGVAAVGGLDRGATRTRLLDALFFGASAAAIAEPLLLLSIGGGMLGDLGIFGGASGGAVILAGHFIAMVAAGTAIRLLTRGWFERAAGQDRIPVLLSACGLVAALLTVLLSVAVPVADRFGADGGTIAVLWLVSIPTVFALGTVSLAVEAPIHGLRATRRRAGRSFEMLATAMVALFLITGAARPVYLKLAGAGPVVRVQGMAVDGAVSFHDLPKQRFDIRATVAPGQPVAFVVASGEQNKLFESADALSSVRPRTGTLTICSFEREDVVGQEQTPTCRPRIFQWLASIYSSGRSPVGQSVVLALTPGEDEKQVNLSEEQILAGAATVGTTPRYKFSVSAPARLAVLMSGVPERTSITILLERLSTSDNYELLTPISLGTQSRVNSGFGGERAPDRLWSGSKEIEAGRYRLCVRATRADTLATATTTLRTSPTSEAASVKMSSCDASAGRVFTGSFGLVVSKSDLPRSFAAAVASARTKPVIVPDDGSGQPIEVTAISYIAAEGGRLAGTDMVLNMERRTRSGWRLIASQDFADDNEAENLGATVLPGSYRLCARRFVVSASNIMGDRSAPCSAPADTPTGTARYVVLPYPVPEATVSAETLTAIN